jgi:dihydrofolate synthase/folylpolyglutamate synthase
LTDLTYDDFVRELFPRLTGGIRWGLERTTRMLEAVGNPHLSYTTIHVGGTNGKGSVAAMLERVLREGGCTGLYVSPHLCTFRERIQIMGEAIGEDALVSAARRLWPAVNREAPSFFEATTAIGFLALAEAGVDTGIIEVGLGGRLDSTNVVRPVMSVLTNVALDHVQFLGPTLESVASEKAGIIKPGVPVVTTETAAGPLGVFLARAREMGASVRVVGASDWSLLETDASGTRIEYRPPGEAPMVLETPLPGRHQGANAALAVAALEGLPPALRPDMRRICDALAGVRWPGRLQIERREGRTWLFDVAHNVAGIESLVAAVPDLGLPRPIVALVGVLGDKDWRGMLKPIAGISDAVILTLPPTAPEDRRWDPAAVLGEAPIAHGQAVPDFGEALHTAWQRAAGPPAGTIVVTGSFHTVGDTMIALRIAPFGADAGLPVPIFAV